MLNKKRVISLCKEHGWITKHQDGPNGQKDKRNMWIRYALLASCFLSTSVTFAQSPGASVVYQITVPSNDPGRGIVRADTSRLGEITFEPPATLPGTASSVPLTLTCHQNGVARPLHYGQAQSCEQVSWPLDFTAIPVDGVEASAQHNVYTTDGFYLLNQWGSLPYIANLHDIQVCPPAEEGHCVPFGQKGAPPTMLPWGSKPRQFSVGTLHITLYSDDPSRWGQPSMIQQLAQQIHHLSALFGTSNTPRQWTLVWLKRDKKTHSLSGAAGNGIFIANYPVADGKPTPDAWAWLLRISCHESVHILTSQTWPAWINESLAEYYAFKTVDAAGIKTPVPLEEWQKKRTNLPHADRGLYQAQQQVAQQHDMSWYPLFYVKGAAFWQDLDQQLATHGQSLDPYLKDLGSTPAHLPMVFVNKMISVVGTKAWLRLQQDYLL